MPTASRRQIYFGRTVGVVVFEINIEQISSVAVGSTVGPHNKGLHVVYSLLVTANKDSVSVVDGKGVGDISELLS